MTRGMDTSLKERILVIDDDPDFCQDLVSLLSSGFSVDCATSASDGLHAISCSTPDVVLLDLDLGAETDGIDLLVTIRRSTDPPPVIMLTGDRRIERVVRSIRMGAFHYLTKPPRLEELLHTIRLALSDAALRRKVARLENDLGTLRGEIVAAGKAMGRVLALADRVAAAGTTVLLTGESGTGKELLARRIHDRSPRREGPFWAFNCAAVPGELIESELFGHEKGAFTGADSLRRGMFEQAAGGSLLLDEVGDSPLELQTKLLRVLEERSFTRVGGNRLLTADVRIIAATSKDVEAQMQEGGLREELYYRLNVFRIHIPPLRERREDILPIARHFLRRFSGELGKRIRDLSPAATLALEEDDWPGNVRQLRNVIERGVILCDTEELDLPDLAPPGVGGTTAAQPYEEARDAVLLGFKRRYLSARLRETQGNVTAAAERSGMRRQSFQRMLQECGIDPAAFREPR